MLRTWFIPMFTACALSGALTMLPVDLSAHKSRDNKKDLTVEFLEFNEPEPSPPVVEPQPPKEEPKAVKPKVQPKKKVKKRVKKRKRVVKPKAKVPVPIEPTPQPTPEPVEEIVPPAPVVEKQPEPARPKVDLGAYGRSIHRSVVKHRRYPRVARRLGLEGKALVTIRVNQEGALLSASIKRSSGEEILDKEALRMVRAAAPFKSLPVGFDKSAVTVVIPVKFKLEE